MNAESGSGSSGTFTWGVIAGIAVLIGAGGLYLSGIFGGGPEETAPDAEVAVQTQEDSAKPAELPAEGSSTPTAEEEQGAKAPAAPPATEEAEPEAPAEEETAEAESPVKPLLDQIFIEPDGNTVLSGTAAPGSRVNVLLDGEPVHSFTVDPSGQFAAFLSVPFADTARGLTLETEGDQSVRSDDYVIAALPKPKAADDAVSATDTAEGATHEPEVADAADSDEPAASDTVNAGAQPIETTDAEVPSTDTIDVAQTETVGTDAPSIDEDAEPVAEDLAEETQDQQVAILRSGEDGVELVQGSTDQPEAADQVALDTIGYSDAGEVELTGRVPDGSAVRLYLDNRLVDDLSPADDGKWRSELDGVEPGVYTLRVDEIAPDGTVVSRLETPFKREATEVLRAVEAADTTEAASDAPPIRSVTVQKGDTLWAISRERFGDGILYVKLFEANRTAIRDPDLIYPGQIFTIPE
ncbi:LysM domain/BON superfamily protein [Ruegeria denitrificans]|uniref:LysM domain/BON superfamily protein n=1 Tax=Ruegeria denitrificans TaxID=1715692 RepID=A0A0P1I4Q7_9RHOB|nr:LysM peptidoglycan-binding domain-containing protein [Ruegeria denitrificans]CUJ89619.1 LysM domain/BON superfamily protein [Ruegeria denitrificans]